MEEKNKKEFRKYLDFEGNSGKLKPLNTQDGSGDLYSIDGYNYALTPEEISSMMPRTNTDPGVLGDSYVFEGYNYPLTPEEVNVLYSSSTLAHATIGDIFDEDYGTLITSLSVELYDIISFSSNNLNIYSSYSLHGINSFEHGNIELLGVKEIFIYYFYVDGNGHLVVNYNSNLESVNESSIFGLPSLSAQIINSSISPASSVGNLSFNSKSLLQTISSSNVFGDLSVSCSSNLESINESSIFGLPSLSAQIINGSIASTSSFGNLSVNSKSVLSPISGNVFGDLNVFIPWIIDIETNSSNQVYGVNFSSSGDFYIDWGDGQESASSSAGTLSHSFSAPGEYRVKILCEFSSPAFIRAGSPLVRKVSSIPPGFNIRDFSNLLKDSINLTSVDKNLFYAYPNVERFVNTFNNCESLTSIPNELFQQNILAESFLGTFLNSGITTISDELFKNNINITTVQRCFEGTNISSLPLELFKNNSLITNFDQCFKNVTSLNGTDVPYDIFNYVNNCTQFRSFDGVEFTAASYGRLLLNLVENNYFASNLDMGSTKYWWYDAENKSLLLNSGWTIYDGGEIPWDNFTMPSSFVASDLSVVENWTLNEIDSAFIAPDHLLISSLFAPSIYGGDFGDLSIFGIQTINITKEQDTEFGNILFSSLLSFSSINDSDVGYPSLFGVLNPYSIESSYDDGSLYVLSTASITIPYSTGFGDNHISNILSLETLYEFTINDLSVSFDFNLPSISSPYFNDLYILEEILLDGLDSIEFGNISLNDEVSIYFDFVDYIGNNLVVGNLVLESIYEEVLSDLTIREDVTIESIFDGTINQLDVLFNMLLHGIQEDYLVEPLIRSHLILGNESFVGFGTPSILVDKTLIGFSSEGISSLGILSSIDLYGLLSYNFGTLELSSDIVLDGGLFDGGFGYHDISPTITLQGFASGSVGNVINLYIDFNQVISWRIDSNVELDFQFNWSSGQGDLKWYRVQGTCIFPTAEGSGLDISGNYYPGGCDVSNFQSDDSKCVGGAGRQLFIQNIVASNLVEVCQILKASNLNWQVSSIKVYSKPVGSNDDVCNVLSDVPIQQYPECIEVALDADTLSLGVVGSHVQIGYSDNEEIDLVVSSSDVLSSTNFVALGSDFIELSSIEENDSFANLEFIENGVQNLIVESELEFEVLHEEGFIVDVIIESDSTLESSNKSISTLCGLCTSIPSQLYVVDSYQDSDIFGRFLSSNNLTYSNNHSLQYNVRTKSWNSSQSFVGEGDYGEEIWNFVYSWNCTNFLADSPSESYWKFYSFINRKIVSNNLDYDTKISINFSQQQLCSLIDNFFNDFSFSINLDNGVVQTDYGIVEDALVFDKIGLFSAEPFISNPWVEFTISRSIINFNNYVFDLTNIISE